MNGSYSVSLESHGARKHIPQYTILWKSVLLCIAGWTPLYSFVLTCQAAQLYRILRKFAIELHLNMCVHTVQISTYLFYRHSMEFSLESKSLTPGHVKVVQKRTSLTDIVYEGMSYHIIYGPLAQYISLCLYKVHKSMYWSVLVCSSIMM